MSTALFGFGLAATLVILAPGPDTMLVMRNTLRGGRRAGMFTTAGTMTGLFTWAVAAGVGLSAVLAASRVGYDVLRIAGAAYLIWLGLTSLWPRAARRRAPAVAPEQTPPVAVDQAPPVVPIPPGLRRVYVNGVISNLCNPKIGVFFVAFLPGFMPRGVSVREFSFALGIWFALETGIYLSAMVWMVSRGVTWFRRPNIQRRLERLTGLVLIGFGLRLATESR
jgi:threonine/homoserine/homoserine lactone efflux protein